MNPRVPGRTGIHVGPLCLGAISLGQLGNRHRDDWVRLIHRALDQGIDFLATADMYSPAKSYTSLVWPSLIPALEYS